MAQGASAYLQRVESCWREGGAAASGAAAGAAAAGAAAAAARPSSAPAGMSVARPTGGEAAGGAGGGGGGGEDDKEDGLVLVVTCICTCVRNVPSPLLKLRLVRLLTEVAAHCQDAIRTGRILPYLVALLSDPLPSVRAEAVAQAQPARHPPTRRRACHPPRPHSTSGLNFLHLDPHLHPHLHSLLPRPASPSHPLLHTLSFTPSPSHPHLHTLSFTPSPSPSPSPSPRGPRRTNPRCLPSPGGAAPSDGVYVAANRPAANARLRDPGSLARGVRS